jgi:hypothetical protein
MSFNYASHVIHATIAYFYCISVKDFSDEENEKGL